jgi:hypothetical protein
VINKKLIEKTIHKMNIEEHKSTKLDGEHVEGNSKIV